jgi:4-hydroxy-3-polyprenylbenzoate decarboxylase
VIEGFIPSPEEAMAPEGPFGEWTGYYAHGRRPETIIEVAAIYHRNDPIIFGSPPVRPIGGRDSSGRLGSDDIEAKLRLEKAGIPGIQRVFSLARPYLRAVALKQMYSGHLDDVIQVLVPGGDQNSGHHIWILVDEDIDVSNPAEVFWAIAGRCAPERDIKIVPGTGIWQLDPRLGPEERSSPDKAGKRKRYTAHNLVINACRPYKWINDFPPVCVNSPELRKRIQEKWRDLFA